MESLRVCLVSRYPPVKGGTASGNYWYARTLGSIGVEVHVVTDAMGNYSSESDRQEYQPKNVTVHVTENIADAIVQVVKEFDIDILDCKYIFPYGIHAQKANNITGLPLVVRHGGSDILSIKQDQNAKDASLGVFKDASLISTSPQLESFFTGMGITKDKITFESGFGINHDFFGPHIKAFDLSAISARKGPVIGFFGKTANSKGLIETADALSKIDADYRLLLIPEKPFESEKKVKMNVLEKTIMMHYQPPWIMPSLYACSDIVVAMYSGGEPDIHVPLSGIEALNAGTCVVTNKNTSGKSFFSLFVDKEDIIIAKTEDPKSYRDDLLSLIENLQHTKGIGLSAREKCKKNAHDGKSRAESMVKLYQSLVKK